VPSIEADFADELCSAGTGETNISSASDEIAEALMRRRRPSDPGSLRTPHDSRIAVISKMLSKPLLLS
jgi:hypothetical protein